MPKEVPIPGGTAVFRVQGEDPIPGRAVKLMRAAGLSAATALSEYPELFEPPRKKADGTLESDEERQERLGPRLEGMSLSTEQAMAWDNLREAAAVGMLMSWTLDQPLPTISSIGDLEAELYDALLDAVGGVSAADLETNFSPGDPKAPGYRETPTGVSEGSSSPSETAPQNPSMTTPPSATAPSAGDGSFPA